MTMPKTIDHGFVWVGQSLESCDVCGRPAREHIGIDQPCSCGPFCDHPSTIQPWGQGMSMPKIWREQEGEAVTMTTYRRADGELVNDEYGWVADPEFFDDCEEPIELVEEVWVLRSARTFWRVPSVLYDCAVVDCDEDAAEWWYPNGGPPVALCKDHLTPGGQADDEPNEALRRAGEAYQAARQRWAR